MKKFLFPIGCAVIVLITACSTPKLADLATKVDLSGKAKPDFNQSKIRESGRGFSVDMKKLGQMPKKVALVSFYVDDPGLTKVTKTGTSTSYNTTNTGSANAKMYANYFYSNSIETLKSSFKSFGMELLTPNEFLDNNDKKQFYNDFVVRHTQANELGAKISKFFKKLSNSSTTIEVDEPADGFNLLKVNSRETSDPKKKTVGAITCTSNDAQMIESIGYDLCKNLEVDAVLIVFNTQLASEAWAGRDNYWLAAANMQLFGPNPTPLKEGKKDNMFYSKGIWYGGFRMTFKKGKLINSAKRKATDAEKAIIDAANVTGYNNVMKGLATKMGTYLTKELNK